MRKAVLILGVLMVLVPASSLFAAADGATLFKAKCAACHGADGKAETAVGKTMKIKPFADVEVKKMTDADLTTMIEGGKGKMPAFKGKLTPEEVAALVKQIRTFQK